MATRLTFKRGEVGAKTKVKVDLRQAGKPLPTGKVVLRVDGQKVKAKVLRNGKVVFTLRLRTPGTHKIRTIYKGDGRYAAVRSRVLTYTAT